MVGSVSRLRVFDQKGLLQWDFSARKNRIDGEAVQYSHEGGKVRKKLMVNFKSGVLDGPVYLEHRLQEIVRFQYVDGVISGPFSVKLKSVETTGRMDDGVLVSIDETDDKAAILQRLDLFDVRLREIAAIYKEGIPGLFWAKSQGHRMLVPGGFKLRDSVDDTYREYQDGLRVVDEPVDGNGIRRTYKGGQLRQLTKLENGRPVGLASAETPNEWTKPPKPPAAKFRPNAILPVIGAGYGLSGIRSFDAALLLGSQNSLGVGGIGPMYGWHQGETSYHSLNAVAGGVAMFISYYAAVGARFDGKVTVPEIGLGLGFTAPMVYLKLAPPSRLGSRAEVGVTLKLPLFL